MSMASEAGGSSASPKSKTGGTNKAGAPGGAAPQRIDVIAADEARGYEHFIPVTRQALAERLARDEAWSSGVAADVRRFFRYLDMWRQQQQTASAMHLLQIYEAFSPDSDLYVTRRYTPEERAAMQAEVFERVASLLAEANFVPIPMADVADMMATKQSYYGLDLRVDFDVFEDIRVYYRGTSMKKEHRRTFKHFLRKQQFDVPIFRRVFVIFKLKAEADQTAATMASEGLSRGAARRRVQRARRHIPHQIMDGGIYLKLFRNLPRADVEMIFPNTEVRFRGRDKLWLGVSGTGAVGAGVFGAAGKLALLLSNPYMAIGAVGGLGTVLYRQISNVMQQKQRYLSIVTRNLYFHSVGTNRGVLVDIADRAAEEDFKEDILLYSVLAKQPANRSDLAAVDAAIEQYLDRTFGLQVDFDVADAYARLVRDGLVIEAADGTISALPPAEAARHVDALWDKVLDDIPQAEPTVGVEFDGDADHDDGGSPSEALDAAPAHPGLERMSSAPLETIAGT